MNGKDECKALGGDGQSCHCARYVFEDPGVCAARDECMHEILEHVATLDRKYSRLPRPPW